MERVVERAASAGVLAQLSSRGDEQLAFWYDKVTGLKSIIAIYDTTLGPALGGVRMFPYPTEEKAVADVLRLAQAMAYKAAAAGLNLGGGKAVILADPAQDKSEGLFRAFGRFVHSLGGRYITTTDVGTVSQDLVWIRAETPHVTGLPEVHGGSGDTSLATALGIWVGMKVCAKHTFGSETLKARRVVVQGVGKVGYRLVEHLVKEGAEVTIADVDEGHVARVAAAFPVSVVSSEAVYAQPCDIFSPNALGAVLNDETIPQLRCAIVAGGANNQLAEERHGALLHRRGILYAPDYVINAGGVINCADELEPGGFRPERALAKVQAIGDTLSQVLALAHQRQLAPAEAADRLAEERIALIGRVHRTYLPTGQAGLPPHL